MRDNSKIDYKTYNVTITTPNGVSLKGEIKYWSKEYEIFMIEPFNLKIKTGNLIYSVPVVYATDEEKRKGIHYINLIEIAKESLIKYYEKRVKNEK